MFVSRFLRHTGHGMAASPHTLPARGQRRPHGRKTTPAASRRPCAPPQIAITSRRAVTGFLAPQKPREDRINFPACARGGGAPRGRAAARQPRRRPGRHPSPSQRRRRRARAALTPPLNARASSSAPARRLLPNERQHVPPLPARADRPLWLEFTGHG